MTAVIADFSLIGPTGGARWGGEAIASAHYMGERLWPFAPDLLFAGGVKGVSHLPAIGSVFTDTGGLTPATFGNAIARINSAAGEAVNARQDSASLRPLLGRAPAAAASGGAIDQGSGFPFVRLDLADDALAVTLPSAVNGDLVIAGKAGTWLESRSFAAGATFSLGPTGTAPTPGILSAIGDVVGWTLIDKTLTAAERLRLINFYKGRGARGLLVPGASISNGGNPYAATDGWTPTSCTVTVVDGKLRLVGTGGTFARVTHSLTGLTVGRQYKFDIVCDAGTFFGTNGPAVWAQPGFGESQRQLSGPGTLTFVATATATTGSLLLYLTRNLASTGLTVDFSRASVCELRPEENW